MCRKKLTTLFCVLLSFVATAQIVEKASLMTNEDPSSEADRPHIYKTLPNGSKLLFGMAPKKLTYHNWTVNGYSLPQDEKYYVALFSKSDSLLWVKYTNGYVQAVEFDSRNNIYLTGLYKDKLHTSDKDTLAMLSNIINHVGNVFIMKLDSTGKRKWWRTTDNEAFGQMEPYGDYLRIDPDFNVYVAGHYEKFIRFDAQTAFQKNTGNLGAVPFLAKLDSSGNYKWVRDWNTETGLPCGLSIDSCRIYMSVILGASQTNVRIRKFDLAGKLLVQKNLPNSSSELFWSNGINVKDNRIAMSSLEGGDKKICYYDINGTKIWEVIHNTQLVIVQFTSQNHLFIAGVGGSADSKIGNTVVGPNTFFGLMDTTGQVLSIKTISDIAYAGLPYLGGDGRVYLNSVVNTYFNTGGSHFTIDTVTFNGLSYFDPQSGYMGGIYYRLFTQFNLQEGFYSNPGNCSFSPATEACMTREGIPGCLPVAFTITATPECVNNKSRIRLAWTVSSNASAYDIYRNGVLIAGKITGTEFVDTAAVGGNTYAYNAKAYNTIGSTNNTNGTVSSLALSCAVTAVIDPENNPFSIKVFPNPSTGKYYLMTEHTANKPVAVAVLNATGQLVYTTDGNVRSGDYTKTINLTGLRNGLYFIRMTIDRKTYLVSVIKQ